MFELEFDRVAHAGGWKSGVAGVTEVTEVTECSVTGKGVTSRSAEKVVASTYVLRPRLRTG